MSAFAIDRSKSDEKKYRCLIANDDQIQLEILEYMFKKAKMDVVTAINGYQAFEILSKLSQEDYFDLVVLDLNMPISDGYETCKNIVKFFKDDGIFKIDQSLISNISS